MKINIFFVSLEQSPFIVSFIEKKFFELDKFSRGKHCTLDIRLNIENDPLEPGPEQYSCELTYHEGKKPIYVIKSSPNVYRSISRAHATFKKTLLRGQKKVLSKRRNSALCVDGFSWSGRELLPHPELGRKARIG